MSLLGDPNSYVPRAPANPRLLKALAVVASNAEPAARQSLYDALLNSTLIVPTSNGRVDAASALGPPLRKPQYLLLDEPSGPAVVAFTDYNALQRWQPDGTAFVAVPMMQLLRDGFPTTACGIWLNLADRSARFISRHELSQITSGLIAPTYSTQVEKDLAPPHEDFLVGAPRGVSAEFVQRLIDTLRREPDVAAGFLMELTRSRGPARLCVGLRLARILEDVVVEAVSKRVALAVNQGRSSRNASIEVILLDYTRYQCVTAVVAPVFDRT